MRRTDTATVVNKIAIFTLLAASVAYHVNKGFHAKKEALPDTADLKTSISSFQKTAFPSPTQPFLVLLK
jgi:hypothetical protein